MRSQLQFRGTGDDFFVVDVPGPAVARISHRGASNFIAVAFDRTGVPSLLVNTIGGYDGTAALGFDGSVPVEIEINADGAWELSIAPLTQATPGASRNAGRGDAVLAFVNMSGRALSVTHGGAANFIVLAWGSDPWPDLLVNHIGPYQGRVRLPPRTLFIELKADGAWTIDVE